MKKGTIIRYQLVRYHEVGGDNLFPRPVDYRLLRRATAQKELQKLQSEDFANGALYGLSRWTFLSDHIPVMKARHYTIEP